MKILDCTLRDGGYYTNWDFDKEIVQNYLDSFNQLPVEYLEVGYRSNPLPGYFGEYFYCPVTVLTELKSRSNKKLVIILNEKDVKAEDAEELLKPIVGLVDMVRLAIDPANFERAVGLAKAVKDLGFEVGCNVMYMSTWKENKAFLDNLGLIEGVADYFYMVDSFGGVYPNDVIETIELLRSKITTPLGFHGHNNLELALVNTLTAIEHGVEIVDSTVTGMGRGAGNLKTELLLTVLNAQGRRDVKFNQLTKTVDDFSGLQAQYGWGTNLPYMVSGAHSLPQKQVMEWVSKRFFSFNSIIRALTNQSEGKKDNQHLPQFDFTKEKKCDAALIVGGGPSVVKHSVAIEEFLKQHPGMPIIHASSRNAMCFSKTSNQQYFCLVGNEGHRLEKVFGDVSKANGICILPPYPRAMGTYIPDKLANRAYELHELNFTDKYRNSHAALAIQSALELGAQIIYTVGYDSYSGRSMGTKEQELYKENEYLFERAKQNDVACKSLTLSGYDSLEQLSIFSLI